MTAKQYLALALAIIAINVGELAAQETVSIGGAGSMVPLMQALAKPFQAKHASDTVNVLPNSLGSTGGIKATEAGRIGIGLTGRPLKDNEKGRLVYRRLGAMPVVIAVHADVPVKSLTQAQLCAIYTGKLNSWKELGGPDTKIVPLTRNEDDSDKEALRQHIGCYRDLREHTNVIVLTKGSEMTGSLANRPGTIGLTTYASVLKSQGRIAAMALDGVAPSLDTVKAGSYRLVKEFAVVTSGQPKGAIKRFLDFTTSPEGDQIMVQAGLVTKR
ncbi:MAG: phosphate ABC transporter substrate-binding protein [Betaproteobacteria bacterium]|nr:phosphate ABC transporter substrate-binding protein [Betaproteobacteria bacterium]